MSPINTYTPDELKAIITEHRRWLNLEPDAKSANLSGADLRSANLRGANLGGANLSGANLGGADLRSADLRSANLYGANLYGAYLSGANLGGANLVGADLRSANLRGADLRSANLRGANLYGAYLSGANLSGADLSGANLRSAELKGANLRNAKLPAFLITPQEGSFIAWKKAIAFIVKLEIPAEARRTSSLVGRKCRAEFVRVLEIEGAKEATTSRHGPRTIYRVGEIVRPDKYDDDIRIECSNGIHFFLTKEEAISW
jgi:Family of unknown function (DUF5758)/Pentapeptide repeats (8 copies)